MYKTKTNKNQPGLKKFTKEKFEPQHIHNILWNEITENVYILSMSVHVHVYVNLH